MAGGARDPTVAATPGPAADPADPTVAPPPLTALGQTVHLVTIGAFTKNTHVKDEC
jgi:hypothetical protein